MSEGLAFIIEDLRRKEREARQAYGCRCRGVFECPNLRHRALLRLLEIFEPSPKRPRALVAEVCCASASLTFSFGISASKPSRGGSGAPRRAALTQGLGRQCHLPCRSSFRFMEPRRSHGRVFRIRTASQSAEHTS
jgi:hypothetical protein